MVDVLGHLGMALVWLAPAWLVAERPKMGAAFVAASAPFGLLPDVDLYLSRLVPTVHHHGVVHTVLAVTLLAAVIGPLVGLLLERSLGGAEWFAPSRPRAAAAVWGVGVWTASVSHLFADMLSAPDVAPPIEPLWPVYEGQILHLDLLWFTSPLATWGLFVLGLALNAVLYRVAGREGGVPSPQDA